MESRARPYRNHHIRATMVHTRTQPAHAPPTTRFAAPPTRDLCARRACPELYVPRRTPRMVAAWPPQSPAAYATRPTLSCAFYTCPRGTEQSEHTATSRAALAPPTQPAQRRRPRRAPRRSKPWRDAPPAVACGCADRLCACMNQTAAWSSALLSTMRRYVRTVA